MFTFDVRVKTKVRKEQVVYDGDTGLTQVAVKAVPEKGKANDNVRSLLADFFDVAVSDISIIKGKTSRYKSIRIESIEPQRALNRLQREG